MGRPRSAGLSQHIPPRPSLKAAGGDGRERIIRTAYELFTHHGLAAVGVDRIVEEAGVAKTTLYRHFRSKDDLIVAVLQRHEDLWLRGWLEPEVMRRATTPRRQLLAIFDALEDWFKQSGYEGCFFTNSVLERHDDDRVRAASVNGIENIYAFVLRLAEEAGLRDPAAVAHQIQLLMRGAFVASVEGHDDAVRQAPAAAKRLLELDATKRPASDRSKRG
jgi:AcrR family transcriptional regulator